MRSLLALCVILAATVAPAAPAIAGGDPAKLRSVLRAAARQAGPGTGLYVLDAGERRRLYAVRDRRARVLASNTKLFTAAAVLAQFGAQGRLRTLVLTDGDKRPDGTLDGDLYLKGGGDPSLSRDDLRLLARRVAGETGITQVTGRVYGDESAFDSLRGGPDSGFGPSPWHGQLSALSVGESKDLRGRTPPEAAAADFKAALEDAGVDVRGSAGASRTPAGASELAVLESPEIAGLVRLTNKDSSNFFAEMLLKDLSAADGDQGTTRDGAREAMAFARRLGARVRLVDGSGLDRGNRAAPRAVVELLDELRERPEFPAFYGSLSIAGVDGTLAKPDHRGLRTGPAKRRCRGKTGTLSGVSAISGYCRARSGDTIVFSILSNGVSPAAMKRFEDRMVQAIARYG